MTEHSLTENCRKPKNYFKPMTRNTNHLAHRSAAPRKLGGHSPRNDLAGACEGGPPGNWI